MLSGAINGLLVAYVRLPAIIATLGMYLFYEGLGTEVLPQAGGNVPVWLVKLNGSIGPIPAVWIVFAVIALVWLLITRGSYLRNLLAVGGDERAAYTAGVNVARLRLITYSMGGVLACLGGLMLTGLIQGGDGTVGPPYTISALTAVALGGISLAGGRGGLLGSGPARGQDSGNAEHRRRHQARLGGRGDQVSLLLPRGKAIPPVLFPTNSS